MLNQFYSFVLSFASFRNAVDANDSIESMHGAGAAFSLSLLHFIESYINNNKHMERIEIVEIEWNSIEKS